MIALLLAAALLPGAPPLGRPADAEYAAALDQLYDGRPEAALARLHEMAPRDPADAVRAYLEALVLAWTVEQRPETTAQDDELLAAVDRAWRLADDALRANPEDRRARFARAAAAGVRSRYHLFRLHRTDAARAAVQMREDLLALPAADHEDPDVAFGLGLYDYYADVLPRYAKLLRWLARLPGGNRARGLREIEAAKASSVLHRAEAQEQLYEIYAFYEDDPERALEEIDGLYRRYRGWPLWGLKMAEHLRDRLGAYPESASVMRRMIAAQRDRLHPPGPGAVALARISLAETLIADLRPAEVRPVLLPIRDGLPGLPAIGPRARLLLGRALELEGDREGALAHYRLAAQGSDRAVRKTAQAAIEHAMPANQVRALALLAEARRRRDSGRLEDAGARAHEALALWPESAEAALGAAEDELARGRVARARALLPSVTETHPFEPPWIRSWSWLLLARVRDAEGDRASAVDLYKKVLKSTFRRAELKEGAAAGLRSPWHPDVEPGD